MDRGLVRLPFVRLLLVVCAAAVLAPSAPARTPDPCALLSNAEVADAIGSRVADRTANGSGLYRTCRWTGTNRAKPGFHPTRRTLMLTVAPGTRAQFEVFAGRVPGAVRVDGVGEVAFAVAQAGGRLEVYAGGYVIEVVASLAGSPLAVERRVAKTVAARL